MREREGGDMNGKGAHDCMHAFEDFFEGKEVLFASSSMHYLIFCDL